MFYIDFISKTQLILSSIDICPRLYPLAEFKLVDNSSKYSEIQDNLKELRTTQANSGTIIELYPPKSSGIFTNDVISSSNLINEEEQKVIDSILLQNAEAIASSDLLNGLDINSIKPEKKFKNEPEIFFLGTISMKPTGSRSAS
jgi:hypothetical protein